MEWLTIRSIAGGISDRSDARQLGGAGCFRTWSNHQRNDIAGLAFAQRVHRGYLIGVGCYCYIPAAIVETRIPSGRLPDEHLVARRCATIDLITGDCGATVVRRVPG